MAVAPRLRVGLHSFQTYAGHRGRDGANLAYEEIVRLLKASETIDVVPHDIRMLANDDALAKRTLSRCDVVVSTVGPHAYMYFYLRERLGLTFRIVRDVRTALWNGYLLQEALCAPYLRDDDTVIYSTAYSRDLFRSIIPVASRESQHVCYPLMHWFPSFPPRRPRSARNGNSLKIGFVGRLTPDKNISQALDLISILDHRRPGGFELHVVGEGSPPVNTFSSNHSVSAQRALRWIPTVSHSTIWEHYARFDLLFFPSTSTLETFGRVIVEASHAGLPVFASDHGSCSELLDTDAILPTAYDTSTSFTAHIAAPLGTIDVTEAAARLLDGPPVPRSYGHIAYQNDAARFLALVIHGNAVGSEPRRVGTTQQQQFISRLRMSDLAPLGDPGAADSAISRLRSRFVRLHQRGPRYAWTLGELMLRSRYRRQTTQFVRRSISRGEDFTNIGGIDLQLSHLIQFYPSFRIGTLQYPQQDLRLVDSDVAQKVRES